MELIQSLEEKLKNRLSMVDLEENTIIGTLVRCIQMHIDQHYERLLTSVSNQLLDYEESMCPHCRENLERLRGLNSLKEV